jgi:hypothetical protein
LLFAVGASAADCPNKWNDPKDVVGTGATKEAAVGDFEKKSKDTAKESKCGQNKCAKDKGTCRAMRTATESCSGDDKTGWKCTGTVRVGCFCLEAKEVGKLSPLPATPMTPGEVACSNKFGDPKDVIGASDQSENLAKTAHDAKLKEYVDAELAFCAQQKCSVEKQSCRLYYTTTNPKCGGSEDPKFPGWSCKSQFRGGCFCLGNDEIALAMAAGVSLPAGQELASVKARPYSGKTMLVGEVIAAGCEPGHTCTVSLVANPDEIVGTPDLIVRKVEVPARKNARGHATLKGQVAATNHAKRQPADGPITIEVPPEIPASGMALEISLLDTPDEALRVPIDKLPPARRSKEATPSAPPVLPENGICVVHDKFSGNGHATKIKVNGSEVPVLAESQELTAFRPGDAVKSGNNEYSISDGGVTKTYKLSSPSVSITAGQTTLEQNGSTSVKVTISDLGGIPGGSWSSPDVAAPGSGGKFSNGAAASDRGYILLTIKNESPNTTTLSGGNLITIPIYKDNIVSGSFTYESTITAQQPGPFQLDATIDSHLAEAPPTGIIGERSQAATEAPKGCCQYRNPASGRWCANETENECLGEWMGEDSRCVPSGSCVVSLSTSSETGVGGESTRTLEHTLDEPHPSATATPALVVPPVTVIPEIPKLNTPHDRANDCPQRHDGCIAMVINFLKVKPKPRKMKFKDGKIEFDYEFEFPSMFSDPVGEIPKLLGDLGCDVQEAVAQFDPIPQPITIGLGRFGDLTIPAIQPLVDEALAHNRHEWGKVDQAILTHRAKIQKNHEVQIEMIVAHGGDRADFGECGEWGMDFPIGRERSGMRRWQTHLADYWLGRKHVCDWLVFDGSCFSGLTPQAVDELENFAPAGHCDGPDTIECPQHAGWESDFAIGTAPSTTTCMAINLAIELSEAQTALRAEKAKHDASPSTYDYADLASALRNVTNGTIKDSNSNTGKFRPVPSYYVDGGYHGDLTAPHHGSSGYPEPKTKKKRP